MTIQEALTRAVGQLSARPELRDRALKDAALLMMHTLGMSRAELIAHPERTFTRDEQGAYQELLLRRLEFEPMQYLLGEQEFYGLSFSVSPGILIPRPETELLVEAVLARVSGAFRVVDVGTGSGAIAVAIARERPLAEVTGVDVSLAALEVAAGNAERNGVRVRFLESDLLGAVRGERFDVVVSNPPYIPVGDREEMHPEVTRFEPEGALFAGVYGMDVYERLVPEAAGVLMAGGLLALEIGFGQRELVGELLRGWDDVEFLEDLQGIPRVALGWFRG